MPSKTDKSVTIPTDQQMAEAQRAISQIPAPLPPEHVAHDVVFYNEISIRRDGFKAGLEAIDAEIEGKKIEREEKIAELERVYASDMASLERRRTMMMMSVEMAEAAISTWRAAHPENVDTYREDETEES